MKKRSLLFKLGFLENGDELEKDFCDLKTILFAGGGGTTRFLTYMVASLMQKYSPDDLSILLCHPSGISWNYSWADAPHIVTADNENILPRLKDIIEDIEHRKKLSENDLDKLPIRLVYVDLYSLLEQDKQLGIQYIKTIAKNGPDVGVFLSVSTYPWMTERGVLTKDLIDCFDTKMLFQCEAKPDDYKVLFGNKQISTDPIITPNKGTRTNLYGDVALCEKNGIITRFTIHLIGYTKERNFVYDISQKYKQIPSYDQKVRDTVGLHIQNIAFKHNLIIPDDFSFIKIEPLFPAFDDMNFRYKNKIYSILFEVINNGRSLLEEHKKYKQIQIAKNNNLIPCVFPINMDFIEEAGPHGYGVYVNSDGKAKVKFSTQNKDGWNLFNTETGEPVDPLVLSNDTPVTMSFYERMNFSVFVARQLIDQIGGRIRQISDMPGHYPQIVYENPSGESCWCEVHFSDNDKELDQRWFDCAMFITSNKDHNVEMTGKDGLYIMIQIKNLDRNDKEHGYKYRYIQIPKNARWRDLFKDDYEKYLETIDKKTPKSTD